MVRLISVSRCAGALLVLLLVAGYAANYAFCADHIVGVSKTDDLGGGCVGKGDPITYDIRYDNSGSDSTAHNVTIVDIMGPYVSFVSATDGGVYDPQAHTVTWVLPEVPGRTIGHVFLTVNVGEDTQSWINLLNQLQLWSDETPVTLGSCHTPVCGAYGNPGAKAAVHVLPHLDRTCGRDFPAINTCTDIVYETQALDVDAFPVFFNLSEYRAVEYGMSWPGNLSCLFTACSDLEIDNIVNSGDGIAQAWTVCQPGPIAIPGWAWIESDVAGQICLVDHPEVWAIRVRDCRQVTELDHPDPVFCAGIGGADGENPCGYPTASEPSTWGGIKSLFGSGK
jgi:uncharacterized repeat protein (TIGR01451 family)